MNDDSEIYNYSITISQENLYIILHRLINFLESNVLEYNYYLVEELKDRYSSLFEDRSPKLHNMKFYSNTDLIKFNLICENSVYLLFKIQFGEYLHE